MAEKLTQRLCYVYNSRWLPWIIILIGIILRVSRYISNPSLWFDEAGNALIIITQSFPEFLEPSPLGQSIPVGFSFLEKLSVLTFGNSEYALRLVPLIAGIASLFLLYKLCKYYLKPPAIPIALGLFTVADPLVYLSSELKPYTLDAAVALLMIIQTLHFRSKNITFVRALFLGALGAIVVWFSHPSVFVLSGMAATLIVLRVIRNKEIDIIKYLISFTMWGAGFLSVYLLYTRNLMSDIFSGNNDFFYNKLKAFMPLPPSALSDIEWFIDAFFRTFDHPMGMTLAGLSAFVFLIGSIDVFREDKEKFFILMSPLIVTLLASGTRMYPFVNEPILFLAPILFILIGRGTAFIIEKAGESSLLVGAVLICMLFVHPLSKAAYHMIKPISHEEIKPVLSYIKNNWQEGDKVFVHYMTQMAFKYYTQYHPDDYSFKEGDYIIARAPKDWYATYKKDEFTGFWDSDKPFSQPFYSVLNEYAEQIDRIKGHKRIWFLFSTFVPRGDISEEKFFIYYLEKVGQRLDVFQESNVAKVYLYDLR